MITTTLNEILNLNPCRSGWDNLTGQGRDTSKWIGNDDPLPMVNILESNGLGDAFWVLRVLSGDDLKKARLLVCDIAERALRFIPDGEGRPVIAIAMSRKFINDECSLEELMEARRNSNAAYDAAAYAADAAAGAAYAGAVDAAYAGAVDAAYAAYAAAGADAAREEERETQKKMFIEFCEDK